MCSRTRGVGWARSGPGSPSVSAEPPRAVRRVRGGGRAGLGPCPCRRDLCACSRAAVVGTSYTLGVSICSSCSARARCFLASTRLPTRKYVCPTCRSCAAACEHAPTPQSPSASKAQVIVRRQGCGRVTGGRRAGGDSCSGRGGARRRTCSREPSLSSCVVLMLVPERFDARLEHCER
eukprot:scaffold31947_cov63-Phaeocystis_antarctica.AAC.5